VLSSSRLASFLERKMTAAAEDVAAKKEAAEEAFRRHPLPEGFTPFPANPPPEKVGTRPQLTTELHVACFDRDAQRVRSLLSGGSAVGNKYRVNQIDVGTTPLALAVRRPARHAQDDADIASIAKMLLDAGADVDAVLENTDPPLCLAAIAGGGASGKPQTVQVLIDAGADLRARCQTMQMTALHWAVTCGFLDVVETLLRAGASATSVSGRKPRETVLQMAQKQVDKLNKNVLTVRVTRDETEKTALRDELNAIARLVEQAADTRKAKKASNKKSRETTPVLS